MAKCMGKINYIRIKSKGIHAFFAGGRGILGRGALRLASKVVKVNRDADYKCRSDGAGPRSFVRG